MMKKLGQIEIFGTKKQIEEAEKALQTLNDNVLKSEPEARLAIQLLIDEKKLKADILYDGNTVWSYDRIIRNVKRIKKEGVFGYASYRPIGYMLRIPTFDNGKPVLSNYFYKFLHLCCGSIAHYDKAGWIATYPTVEHLKNFFRKNEFGMRVLDYIPNWQTDAKRIVVSIEEILGV